MWRGEWPRREGRRRAGGSEGGGEPPDAAAAGANAEEPPCARAAPQEVTGEGPASALPAPPVSVLQPHPTRGPDYISRRAPGRRPPSREARREPGCPGRAGPACASSAGPYSRGLKELTLRSGGRRGLSVGAERRPSFFPPSASFSPFPFSVFVSSDLRYPFSPLTLVRECL